MTASEPRNLDYSNVEADCLPSVPSAGISSFQYTRSFIINDPIRVSQFMRSEGIGLHILARKRMIGAEDPSDRTSYPRRSLASARKNLRRRIIDWVEGKIDCGWRMVWIMGPEGVGKSAIAQRIADSIGLGGQLAACLFFSPRNNDSTKIMATLAYQLAAKHAWYRHIVTQQLANDPDLLEKDLHIQFKQLIIHPFRFMMTHDPSILRRPPLIILDGLEEVDCKMAQCELVELIAEHVRTVQEFPLLWLVCTKPEWYFRYLLSQPDFPIVCKRENLKDDMEAKDQDGGTEKGPVPGLFTLAATVMRHVEQAPGDGWQLDAVVLGPMNVLEELTRSVMGS